MSPPLSFQRNKKRLSFSYNFWLPTTLIFILYLSLAIHATFGFPTFLSNLHSISNRNKNTPLDSSIPYTATTKTTRIHRTKRQESKDTHPYTNPYPSMDTSAPLDTNANANTNANTNTPRMVHILEQGLYHVIVEKPPSIVCHHSGWAGLRSSKKNQLQKKKKKEDDQLVQDVETEDEEEEIPMLQRVRDTLQRRVNLVHRLDRGASGILLCTFADSDDDENSTCDGDDSIDGEDEYDEHELEEKLKPRERKPSPTSSLIQAMASTQAQKTYVALVRGEGILHGQDLKSLGWFPVHRPIKSARGVLKDATTWIRFVAGQGEIENEAEITNRDEPHLSLTRMASQQQQERPRLSIVLARPQEGRWHQIRRHLNGLSHPILGDSSHGNSRVNREWRDKRGLSYERTCLHLARLQLPPTEYTPQGIDISCPVPQDMMLLLQKYAPEVLQEAKAIFEEEGIRETLPLD